LVYDPQEGFVCKKYRWIDIEKVSVDNDAAIGYKPHKVSRDGEV
jgi:hypothetical protein